MAKATASGIIEFGPITEGEAPDPTPGERIRATAAAIDGDGDPPPRRDWLAGNEGAGWLPSGRLAMLTGEGGAGKSRLALQLACAVAGEGGAEARWVMPSDRLATACGPVVALEEPGTVAYIGWEDETAEARRRLRWLRDGGLSTAGGNGGRLHYLDAAGAGLGALWGPADGGSGHTSTQGAPTEDGLAVRAWLESLDGLALVVIDPLAAAYGSNENDRALVRQFLAHWNGWAAESGAAVLLVAHPPKTGATFSGSTDWRNGVRALWTLTNERAPGFAPAKDGKAEPLAPCLTLDKASYGRAGARAWMQLHALEARGRTTGLVWRECGPVKAAQDYAEAHGLTIPPALKGEKKKGDPRQGELLPDGGAAP